MNLLAEHKLRNIIRQIIINENAEGLPYFMQVLQSVLIPKVSEGGSLYSIWVSMMSEPEKLKAFEAQLLALFKDYFQSPIARDEPMSDPSPDNKEELKESKETHNLETLLEFLEEKLTVKTFDDGEEVNQDFLLADKTEEEEPEELTPEQEAMERPVLGFGGTPFKDLTPDQKTGVRAAYDEFGSISKEIEKNCYSELFGQDRVNFNKYFLANLEAYFEKYNEEFSLQDKPEVEDPSVGMEEPTEEPELPVEEPEELEATQDTEEVPEAQ